MGKPGPMQTPITARIKRTTQGGMTTQPLLNMGAPVKMKRTPVKKSLVGNQDQLPANLQADIKAAPGKMYDSPAKVDKKYLTPYREKVALRKDRASYEKQVRQDELDKSKPLSEYLPTTRKAVQKRMKSFQSKFGARVEGEKGWAADDAKRKKEDSVKVDPVKVDPVKVDPKKTTKSYVKKGGTATGNMKDYKIGSQKRRDEYTARGWKQDKTTAVKGGAKKKKVADPVIGKSEPTKKVAITTKLDPTKKTKVTSAPKETSKRAAKLRAKGNAVLNDKTLSVKEKQKKSRVIRKKYDKKNAKVAKKTKKGTNRVEYDESTGKGGSVLGNALRTVTGKRKRDKAAAERRKNAPGGNMI